MPFVRTDDGVQLHHEVRGQGRPLVLLHGWPFSARAFDRVVPELAEHAQVVTVDLRGFGDSGKPDHGYRVSRLAADLRDLLAALDLRDVTLLGWSLGCAVAWSYLELFGSARLAQLVLVQQSPRQWRAPDWSLGHAVLFDQAQFTALAARVEADLAAFDEDNLDAVVRHPLPPEERALLLAECAKSPARCRLPLMADHTSQDWRDLLPTLDLPTLVLAARHDTGSFSAEALAWVGDHVPGARTVFFDDSSHAIHLDETAAFVATVRAFLAEV